MPTQAVRVTIPDDLDFAALRLQRDPVTLEIEFDWAPIEAICKASGLDVSVFRDQLEDNLAGLLVEWYRQHRARGGAPDPVQEQILAEVAAESVAGPVGVISHSGKVQ